MSKLDTSATSGYGSKSILSFVKKLEGKSSERDDDKGTGTAEKEDKATVTATATVSAMDVSLSQLDPEVMAALPDDIRQEVEKACHGRRQRGEEGEDPVPRTSRDSDGGQSGKSLLNATISQLDPEYLAELPEDIAEEVKQQLMGAKVLEKQREQQRTANAFDALMGRSPPKKPATPVRGKKRGRPAKNSPRFVKKTTTTTKERIEAGARKTLFETEEPEDEVEGGKAEEKGRDDEEKEEEEEEANLEGETEVDGVRRLLKLWLSSSPSTGPTADDVSTVCAYFSRLVRQRARLDRAPPLLRTLERLTGRMATGWGEACGQIVSSVQKEMVDVYGHKMAYRNT